MLRAWVVATLLVLTSGCRERNPEWLGPASDVGTGSTSQSQSPTSSGADDSSGGEPIPCVNNNQCPEGFLCGPAFCQEGDEGDPCTRTNQCNAETPICSSSNICQDGSPGDPCSDATDCQAACESDVCGVPG